jgi:hypothetical protein
MAKIRWNPSHDEVRRIVAELRPVIDECERRAREALAVAEGDSPLLPRSA